MPTTIASDQPSLLHQAQASFASASDGQLSIIDLFNTTLRLSEAGQPGIAIDLFKLWLARTTSPLAYMAQFNLAITLTNTGDDAGAELAYRAALAQKPDFIECYLNLGALLERNGHPEEALTTWKAVLRFCDLKVESDRTFYIQALNNLGRLLELLNRYSEAEDFLARSLQEKAKQKDVITHWVHLRQKLCKWPVYADVEGDTLKYLRENTSALAMLCASDDPTEQLATARRYVEEKVLKGVHQLSRRENYGHDKIRIGYMSSDFCSHAVSILTAELYGLHDRERFIVYCFDWSKADGSLLRQRVLTGMDYHVPIHALNDEDAARLIRAHEIDILVDLHGLTLGARHNILTYRPAPLQVTWLGFPGSTGLPEIDYVVCDDFVFPPELQPHFTEIPLRLPRVFQINDRQRQVGPLLARADLNLPQDGFVFCAFNNNFKITPEMFATWMRILLRVPDSVLWITADKTEVRENLRLEAEHHGVLRERLIFAAHATPAEYLARFKVADLFLDTYPFGAGTTASDVLWAGLPLLTCTGPVFASRMAGSLLRAVNLSELITYNLKDFEDKAVSLAQNRAQVEAMKRQLNERRLDFALFDSPGIVRELESAFVGLVEALPAPARSPSWDKDLSYLEPPFGKPNLDKPIDDSERRYVIVAPPYKHNSAGIRVLYDLQKWLIRAGLDAIVVTWFQGYPVEQFQDDIVIYPEVAPGNLLGAQKVIRYIMNVPGKLGMGEKSYDPKEILIAYNKDLVPYSGGRILQVPSVEPFFHDSNTQKTCDVFFVGKGNDLGVHPPEAVAITKVFPAKRREMARLLRQARVLYSYDDFSMILYEAKLCGCHVKVINKDGQFVDYDHPHYPTLEEFKVQLNDFIELTKNL